MKVIGFSFTKISAERLKDKTENIKFNTKIDISSINPFKSEILRTKDELVKVDFIYTVFYEPEFAKLEFAGNIILSLESKIAREVLKGFKDQNTSEEFRLFILNLILRKSNIRALQLEDELGLPPHIPLISLKKENFKQNKDQ